MKTVYLDNAATTPVLPEVFEAMKPYFLKFYGNPSEFHEPGTIARQAVEKSRKIIADFFAAKPSEVIFTSSATESINLGLKGLVESLGEKPHIISTRIEHKAVLETCAHLEALGKATVTYLDVDRYGLVKIGDLEKAIKKDTRIISVGFVNNEVGTVQPIAKIGKLIKKINKGRKNKIYFHTDATQAVNYLDCNVDTLGVDLLSMTGHKIGAPKGVGVLYQRRGVELIRQIDGGAQEMGERSGTENVPYIVGLGKAVTIAKKLKIKGKRVKELRDRLIKGVLKIGGIKLTGHPTERVPHIASFVIDRVEGEALVLRLSDAGIIASSGSACTSGDLKPSHVLTAMGIPPERSHGSLRFSLSVNTTKEEIDFTLTKLAKIIRDVRLMAPDF